MNHFMKAETLQRRNLLVRFSGFVYVAVIIWNIWWISTHLNLESYTVSVFSVLFLVATILVSIGGLLMVINNWHYESIKPLKLNRKIKPTVAIIIPSCGEPVDIVMNTLKSVVFQDWPKEKRVIIVSDDAHDPALRFAVHRYSLDMEDRRIIYFDPPRRESVLRHGEAKAGNLNAALYLIIRQFPYVKYIETRDADDLVGNPDFLSYCVGHLERSEDVSFVQTIKQCRTHPDDPFSNNESVFYRMTMPARSARNAVFPCGSGLVWRLSELKRLQGFPIWNLVEDLQSGYEILRKGGKGSYLPIVGAVAQIAPEDMANFYKQRGTWALDSLRLFYWRNPLFTKGLNIWQKLQFFEVEFSYLLSCAVAIFVLSLIANLGFHVFPIIDTSTNFLLHIAIFALAMEAFNFIKAGDVSYADQSRSRQMWFGLMPVFIISAFMALFNGPNHKPSYKVTRKYHKISWYWRETLVQKLVVISLSISVIYSVFYNSQYIFTNLAAILWSLFFIHNFYRTVKNSWHGINFSEWLLNVAEPVHQPLNLRKFV